MSRAQPVVPLSNPKDGRLTLWLSCLFILIAVLACYWPVRQHEFTNYDDPQYITQNQMVLDGLTRSGLSWAMTTFDVSNWHPVTWLSHMIDVQLHGMNAGRHLLTNVVLHAINSMFVLVLIYRMTGRMWPAAIAGMIFGVHPLHVESVAWISERKDLLSTLFGLLTLVIYLKWAKSRQTGLYVAMILLYALSLMSKPMLVTLPMIMLLFDCWPLSRWGLSKDGNEPRFSLSIVIEKIPFFIFSFASCIITVLAQSRGGAVQSVEQFPLMTRLANAALSYVHYLIDAVYPANLAVIYPYDRSVSPWQISGAIALLAFISLICVVRGRTMPHLAMGWLLFLGTLVPVIGIVQVGIQARADRYMYFPMIGLLIMICGSRFTFAKLNSQMRAAVALVIVIGIGAFALASRAQVHHWRNSVILFEHALQVTHANVAAELQLALAWSERGDTGREYKHYQNVLAIDPDNAVVHNNIGHDLLSAGKAQDAIGHFTIATKSMPGFARAHFNLGVALASLGAYGQAVSHYQTALRLRPDLADAHDNLGIALQRLDRLDEAIASHREAVRLVPASFASHFNLAWALFKKGDYDASAEHYRQALQLNPSLVVAHVRLGDIAVAQQRKDDAVRHYRAALERDPANAEALRALNELQPP